MTTITVMERELAVRTLANASYYLNNLGPCWASIIFLVDEQNYPLATEYDSDPRMKVTVFCTLKPFNR